MAHEVENMFFVGKTPWHGLGTRVDADIQIPEALKAAGLDWFVAKEQLYLANGTEVPDSFATVRQKLHEHLDIVGAKQIVKGEKEVLGVVGARYQVYQNWEAFKWFEPYLESKLIQLHTAGSLQGGKRVWILAKVNGMFTVAKNDDVELYLLLSHAHDGSMVVQAGTTPIRVVCANTLRVAHSDPASRLFKVKHSSKEIAVKVDKLRSDIDLLIHGFQTTFEAYKHLASKQITEKQMRTYAETVFDVDPALMSTRIHNQIDRVVQLFDTGMGNNLASVNGTAWAAYNAFTQWLSYERGNSPDSRINSLWFGDSVKLNKRALDCALAIN